MTPGRVAGVVRAPAVPAAVDPVVAALAAALAVVRRVALAQVLAAVRAVVVVPRVAVVLAAVAVPRVAAVGLSRCLSQVRWPWRCSEFWVYCTREADDRVKCYPSTFIDAEFVSLGILLRFPSSGRRNGLCGLGVWPMTASGR